MKLAILILALVAVTAYAVPVEEDTKIENLIEKLLASHQQTDEDTPEIGSPFKQATKQENEQDRIESLLAQMQTDADEEAIIEAYFAQEQVPAHLQSWWKKTWRKVKRFAVKHGPTIIRHGVRFLLGGK